MSIERVIDAIHQFAADFKSGTSYPIMQPFWYPKYESSLSEQKSKDVCITCFRCLPRYTSSVQFGIERPKFDTEHKLGYSVKSDPPEPTFSFFPTSASTTMCFWNICSPRCRAILCYTLMVPVLTLWNESEMHDQVPRKNRLQHVLSQYASFPPELIGIVFAYDAPQIQRKLFSWL
jgi:hypothetical protein